MEKLLQFVLRNRLLMVVFGLLVLAAGAYSYRGLPVDAFPDVTPVLVQVFTETAGLAPEEVEKYVTYSVEFAMLGGLRPSVVVLAAIPFSLAFSFLLMRYFGLSANLMSLGGLAIALGLLVDGSVVMVENIDRMLREEENGEPAMLVGIATFLGCSGNGELIRSRSVGVRTDVFEELQGKTPIPKGHADLRIVSSWKTHRPGYSLFDDKPHGTAAYMLLVDIDGQAIRVKATLEKEGVEPGTPRTPETGEGIRYHFGKDLRLGAGVHRLFVALPEAGVAVEKEILLADGSRNLLRLEPVYRSAKKEGSGARCTSGENRAFSKAFAGSSSP